MKRMIPEDKLLEFAKSNSSGFNKFNFSIKEFVKCDPKVEFWLSNLKTFLKENGVEFEVKINGKWCGDGCNFSKESSTACILFNKYRMFDGGGIRLTECIKKYGIGANHED